LWQSGFQALEAEQLRLVDWFTDELYTAPAAAQQREGAAGQHLGHPAERTVRAPVSRLVVDVERFPDDENEAAAEVGMGAVYTLTTSGESLRRHGLRCWPQRRAQLMERYYWPHHELLNRATAECLRTHGRCLVLDCHSFPSGARGVPELPTQTMDLGGRTPQVCRCCVCNSL
jgi:N-formylglutamate deformylase